MAKRQRNNKGIFLTMAKKYTTEQLDFIKRYKTLPIGELAERFNEKFGTNKSANTLSGLKKRHGWKSCYDGRFKPGNTPFNKGKKGLMKASSGSFKPGNMPTNHRPIGSERINIYGYIEIKIAEPNQWTFKHRLVWEQHHGPIPENTNIVFKDGNPLNCDIDNLDALSKMENFYCNIVLRVNKHPEPLRPIARTIAKLEAKIQGKTK